MPMSPALMVAALAAFAALLVLLFMHKQRRWREWEAVLEHVARTFRGKYTKGYKQGLIAEPGSMEAEVDDRSISIEVETKSSYGSDVETRVMVVEVGSGKHQPMFLGPKKKAPPRFEVDFGDDEPVEEELSFDGLPGLLGRNVSGRLRTALEQDAALRAELARFFADGGTIEYGDLVLRTTRFERNPDAMVQRIEQLLALGGTVARHA